MANKTYGYVRVSSRDQNEDRQMIAMTQFGVPPSCVIIDKQSGKDFVRKGYCKLIRKIKPGDTIVVKSIDRLGRDYDEILEQWRIITKEKAADIVVLDMKLLDTRNGRDLLGTVIADIVLQLLSYVAETERANIRERQKEGIEAAKARGVQFGRPKMDKPENFGEIEKKINSGELSIRTAANILGISHPTLSKWLNEEKNKKNLEK